MNSKTADPYSLLQSQPHGTPAGVGASHHDQPEPLHGAALPRPRHSQLPSAAYRPKSGLQLASHRGIAQVAAIYEAAAEANQALNNPALPHLPHLSHLKSNSTRSSLLSTLALVRFADRIPCIPRPAKSVRQLRQASLTAEPYGI
jgi:hypothetical protein